MQPAFILTVSKAPIQALSFENYIQEDYAEIQLPVKHLSFLSLLEIVYFVGVFLMIFRFLRFIQKIRLTIRLNRTNKIGNICYVLLNGNGMLFSFFNFIFISKLKLSETKDSQIIIEHEKVHIRELHSLDLLISEIACSILWFNPFIFLYRYAIKINHEYIADSKVIRSGVNPVDYMKTLAKEVMNNHAIGLTSNFNYSLTKKRLMMLTKIKNSKIVGLRFLLIMPLLCFLLLAFAKLPITKSQILQTDYFTPLDIFSSETPSIMPIKNKDFLGISSSFGMRIHPIYKIKGNHYGIDLKANPGTPVYATASGIITSVFESKNYQGKYFAEGIYVVIRHNDQYNTKYTHLSSIIVKKGERVKTNQVIGYVGDTGTATGPHLHYEVIRDGQNVNPIDYITKINF